MGEYWLFLIILLGVAAVVKGDFVFTVLYFILGAYIFGRWWSSKALKNIKYHRYFESRAFIGEDVPVRLDVHNSGWLPITWFHLYESLPVELAKPNAVNQVLTLGARSRLSVNYTLHTRKRGYYPIGPLVTTTGDLLGLSKEKKTRGDVDHLTVYPRIILLTHPMLTSWSPQGSLRSNLLLFEDPSRVQSKRDYVAGDSLKRIDWKASAIVGRLQVKKYEPSIALETVIFLNLNSSEYDSHYRIDSTELAIVIAASLSNWIVTQKQAIGLITNGVDTLEPSIMPSLVSPRNGRSHLIRVLEKLARLRTADTIPITDLLRRESVHLSWGTTIIIITGKADELFFDGLFQARRRGLNAVLILVGQGTDWHDTQYKAGLFGFPVFVIKNERDLDIWRQ